uniref:Endonuclease/exonuclease/phosphatase domain-containing protein n=1 Tax=Octopus bimaculoides TaxID=37653 RepID=A0A0L8GQH6_OCTBM
MSKPQKVKKEASVGFTIRNELGDVIGTHGVGKANSDGYLLLLLCSEYGLLITNTLLQLSNHHKTTWRHFQSNHYLFIDYIVVRSSIKEDVQVTRSFSTGEHWSNHRLIRSNVNFTIRSPIRNNHTPLVRKVDVTMLRNNDNLTSFQTACDNKLAGISDNTGIESMWFAFKNAPFESSCETLGYVKRKHQDWVFMDLYLVAQLTYIQLWVKLLTNKSGIMNRWVEHFSNVLNMDSIVDEELINNLPQKPVLEELLNDVLASLVLPESLCSFRAGRGTVNMIFSLKLWNSHNVSLKLRWSSHLSRKSDIRIPKQLPVGQFLTGKSVQRPLLRFRDKLKDSLK